MNFSVGPQEGGSTFRPTYVLVYKYVGEKDAHVDSARVSSLVGLKTKGFTIRNPSNPLQVNFPSLRKSVMIINMI